MKTVSLVIFCAAFLWFCNMQAKKREGETTTVSSLKADTINYQTQVQPILEKHCSPCHFPGGKMYEKMPFDNGATIVGHEAGILRRIKEEKDVALIRQYVAEQAH